MGPRAVPCGWVVLATRSVTETVTWGIVHDGVPVVLRPMEETLGASLLPVAVGGYDRVFWLITASLVVAGAGVLLATPSAEAEDRA